MMQRSPEIDYSKLKTQITQFFSSRLLENGNRIEILNQKDKWVVRVRETSEKAKLKTLEFSIPKSKAYYPLPVRTDDGTILHFFKNSSNCESSLIITTKNYGLYVFFIEMKSILKSNSIYYDLEKKVIGSAILILTILRFLEIDYSAVKWKVIFAYYKNKIPKTPSSKGDLIQLDATLVSTTRPNKKYIKILLPWGKEFRIRVHEIETNSNSHLIDYTELVIKYI